MIRATSRRRSRSAVAGPPVSADAPLSPDAPASRPSRGAPDATRASRPGGTPAAAGDTLDTRFLEALVGYNARRAALAIAGRFYERMAPFELKQAEFSVLILLADNPGSTSRQLCATLDILPPNFVRLIGGLERRGLIERRPHPQDGRALGLFLTGKGRALAKASAAAVVDLEVEVVRDLTDREIATLRRLLRRLYPGG